MNKRVVGAVRLPSLHVVRAALHVGSILGDRAAPVLDARESYWHHATGGTFSPADLRLGEQLLIDCRLLTVEDGHLIPTQPLGALLDGTVEDAIAFLCKSILSDAVATQDDRKSIGELDRALEPLLGDEERRRELLLELGRRFDDTRTSLIGAIGEECVVEHARSELRDLGHRDLARAVRRVSLVSDQLGYDVVAPRIDGRPRLLEVKTAIRRPQQEFSFFISRNELETGLRTSDWALVACAILDENTRSAEILGWSPAAGLRDRLPTDVAQGRWTEAQLSLPLDELYAGLPRLVA
jgi:Domain of unknown function (DUF3883)